MPSTTSSRPEADAAAPKLTIPPASAAILAWYDRHRRVLPWRALPGEGQDPYRVWLSEIMLQQTTVQAVKPFYLRFLERWPSVEALAAAPTEAVMQAWAGLGYYSRARNLHACAIAVVSQHGGRFPDSEAGLKALPGVGAYTAAAVAAIAFGRDAVVVDGNVERVMARLYAVETPLPRAKAELGRLMGGLTPSGRAGDFAQAVMDLGATICTPRSPACAICPARPHCEAARLGVQVELPRRLPKGERPTRHGIAYLVVDETDAILLRTRPPRGLLGGMAELPGTEWRSDTGDAPDLRDGDVLLGRLTHVFTHFTLLLDVVSRQSRSVRSEERQGSRWVLRQKLDEEPLPTLMRNAIALADKAKGAGGTIPPPRWPGSRKHRRS